MADQVGEHFRSSLQHRQRSLGSPSLAPGPSDHSVINQIPAYRQKLQLSKPCVVRSELMPQRNHDKTDWDLIRTASNSLGKHTEVVTNGTYISFCEDSLFQARGTRVSYNNDSSRDRKPPAGQLGWTLSPLLH